MGLSLLNRRGIRGWICAGLALLVAGMGARPARAEELGLSLSSSTLRFPDGNASTTPSLASQDNPVLVSVNYAGTGNWVLTVLASGDLQSAESSIAISNIRWSAAGNGFYPGTLSKTSPQSVATGTGSASGTLSFFLANRSHYASGHYTQEITFTVTSF